MVGGYVYLRLASHPKCNSSHLIAEHRVVWEKETGRQIPDGWVVHHINGVKTDNRFANLYAMPGKNHSSGMLMKALRKRLRAVEAELKTAQSQAALSL